MIRFYFHPTPNPFKVSLFLEEAKLPYEIFPVDTSAGEQHAAPFRAINPNGKVPAIVDTDGPGGREFIVFDSGAILLYLGDKISRFVGTSETRGELLSWLFFVSTGLGPFSGQAVHFQHSAPEKIPYAINRFRREAERHYQVLDEHLTDREFVVGTDYSIVDMAVWGWLRRASRVLGHETDPLATFPNLRRLFDAVNARPAAARARDVGKDHAFKRADDEQSRRALYPSNYPSVRPWRASDQTAEVKADTTSLQDRLDAHKAQAEAKAAPEATASVDRAIEELIASGRAGSALQVGMTAPTFQLKDADGNLVDSTKLLDRGPLVVTFYRGVWCPYCNLDLQSLQEALPSIEARGARLVSISPQNAANSRKAARNLNLTFPILSDPKGAVADTFGVRWSLPDYLIDLYKNTFKLDIAIFNDDDSYALPMPSRFVIAPDGVIAYGEVSPDYKRRPDPSAILPVLDRLAQGMTDR